MKPLFELLENRPIEKSKIDYEFQALGIEMQPIYGKRVWSLFYKYNLEKIRDAFKIAQRSGISSFPYLIGIIKKLK